MNLTTLLGQLSSTPAMLAKQQLQQLVDIGQLEIKHATDVYALPGDDCAAIALGEQYLLHACEGMLAPFVAQYPYFAGWSAVMANLSDIAAMGGRALSLVNSYWQDDASQAELLRQGMQAACRAYGVNMVGGHSHLDAQVQPALAVAIQGIAKRLLSVFHVTSGQKILLAINLKGQFHGDSVYWKCFEQQPSKVLQAQLELLALIAERGLAHAARDISNAGILGSLLMLLEATGSGAVINLHDIPKPEAVSWSRWLQIFPSYGFVISSESQHCSEVIALFASQGIDCVQIGEVNATAQVEVCWQAQRQVFWDFAKQAFTGMNYATALAQCPLGTADQISLAPQVEQKQCPV
jgi:AIR synthase-related protein